MTRFQQTHAWKYVLDSQQIIAITGLLSVSGMRVIRENRSPRRKRIPAPRFPPQIPHHLAWGRTHVPLATNSLTHDTTEGPLRHVLIKRIIAQVTCCEYLRKALTHRSTIYHVISERKGAFRVSQHFMTAF